MESILSQARVSAAPPPVKHKSHHTKRLTVASPSPQNLSFNKKALRNLSFTEAAPLIYMRIVFRLILPVLACLLLLCAILLPSRSAQKSSNAPSAAQSPQPVLPNDSTKPLRLNTLGLAYKDLADFSHGVAAFEHVTEILPDEADAYYFVGYLYSQLQQYDQAIAAFQKGLALFPYHASSEFGIARAYQRKGDSASAREHLAKFQNITTNHLGAPFGAGYGDQGRLSLAELPNNPSLPIPPAIPVHFAAQNLETLLQNP